MRSYDTSGSVSEQSALVDVEPTRAVPFVPEQELVARLLAENAEDYMSLGFFAHLVSATEPAGDLRRRCIGYLDYMIREGYVVVGTVQGATFLTWVLGAAQTREAIARQWPKDSTADYENLRDIGWLANTSKGNDLARDYLDSHRNMPSPGRPMPSTAGRRTATGAPRTGLLHTAWGRGGQGAGNQ
jgi:hypothetical protein